MHAFLEPGAFGVLTADVVAKVILRAATARRPRTRYSVGFIARLGPLGRALFLKGDIELLPADLMDHTAAHPAVIPPAPTAEYGKYPSVTCRGCHAHTLDRKSVV